jgi:hypothetical protein
MWFDGLNRLAQWSRQGLVPGDPLKRLKSLYSRTRLTLQDKGDCLSSRDAGIYTHDAQPKADDYTGCLADDLAFGR